MEGTSGSRRIPEPVTQWAPVLLVVVLAQLDLVMARGTGSEALHGSVAVLTAVPLAWRRRSPVVVAGAVMAVLVVVSIVGAAPLSFSHHTAALIVTYAVGCYARGGKLLVGAAVIVVGVAVVTARMGLTSPAEAVFPVFYFSAAWLVGRSVRVWRARATQLRELAQQLEDQADQQAQLALAQERTRIARELHDIVAHTLSTVVLQAEAADEVLTADPDRARQRLHSIERASREGLVEMRRLLGVLRADDEGGGAAPQPSLADLPSLVQRMRAAELPVELTCEGELGALSPGLQVSAYRIVQEALTNSLKHAGAVPVRVSLRLHGGALHIEIADRGAGSTHSLPSNGHGLVGMRERAALFGGHVAVSSDEDGFVVSAVLPVEGAAT